MQSVTDSCTLHDIGEQDGVGYLVMEFLEGETLADQLKKGALTLDQALRYAAEISDALDKAHRQGVVHRDLKPGNIMLTKSGAKLLDFGLAKLRADVSAETSSMLSALPTEEKPLTEKGSIIGTFQYMAPEQLEGKDADTRTDIFAFGTVMYEMLTGRKAFEGKSQASLISAIMGSDPPAIAALQPMTPPALDRVVLQCLPKDPDDRWQTAGDLRRELSWIAEGGRLGDEVSTATVRPTSRERLLWGTAVVSLIAALILFAMVLPRAPKDNYVLRLSMTAPEAGPAFLSTPSVSPDGRHVVFRALDSSGTRKLWVRTLDSLEWRLLPGTEGASQVPFWSPDSHFVAFFSQDKLKKIPFSGGPVQTICTGDTITDEGEGTWSRDGVILFMPREHDVLYSVSASGSVPKPLTTLDTSRGETGHFYPQFLPDGRHFLYLARGTGEEANGVYRGSLDSDQVERVFSSDSSAVYAPPGYLLFMREGNLLAQTFDVELGRPTGESTPIATRVSMNLDLRGNFTVSESGILVYKNREREINLEISWFDRSGRRLQSVGEPGPYYDIELSPDGTRLAMERLETESGTGDIWQLDLSRNLFSRLTTGPAWNMVPRWSPDGERIAFMSWDPANGVFRSYQVPSKGTVEPELLFDSARAEMYISDLSRDGRYIAFHRTDDLLVLPLFGEREPIPFLDTEFRENQGRFSPGGRFFAYVSDETGRREVYVTTFPEPGSKWRISTEGGQDPRWRSDGEELFYLSAEGTLMAVKVELGSGFAASIPEELFPIGLTAIIYRSNYTPAADGQRFLVLMGAEGAPPQPFNVVLNWTAELEQ